MFTGIVQATSRVMDVSGRDAILRVRLAKPRAWKLSVGSSVAVDGICSTVVAHGARSFDVEYMTETLSKTTAGAFTRGRLVNLERPLRAGDPLGGHLVQGHVDVRGTVSRVEKVGASRVVHIRVPHALSPLIARGGSITMDGVSLTVARKTGLIFVVSLIPHTLSHTTLSGLIAGKEVNLEADIIARTLLAGRFRNGRVRRNATKRIREKTHTA